MIKIWISLIQLKQYKKKHAIVVTDFRNYYEEER